MKRTIAIILCAALTLTVVVSCSEAERPLTVAELLEVAERYLLEENYEQALVEFMRVIEVEPREPRGYTGAADALIGLGRYDEARAILEQGLSVLPGNADTQRMLEDLHPSDFAEEPESELEPEPEPEPGPELDLGFLSVLPDLLETDEFETLQEILNSDELNDFINQITSFPFIQLEECGTRGIIIYGFGGGFGKMYIGEFLDNQRSGFGTLISWGGLHIYRYDGQWANDLPNGNGTETKIYETGPTVRTGYLVNGLWHGTVRTNRTGYSNIVEYYYGRFANVGERYVPRVGSRWPTYPVGTAYIEGRGEVPHLIDYMVVNEEWGIFSFAWSS